ncbi:MAG TPA: ATP-binding protein, partial [Pyrinomonadaceae bacterium]|nr:ATP-binding protein [Pyrinomonadaceae bacterium]
AVSNVCRHAQAARVRLRLHATAEGHLLLELEDDGRGFDPADKKARTGRGLAGIRARAHMIDADVTWTRRPDADGGGTVFTLRKTGAARQALPGS